MNRILLKPQGGRRHHIAVQSTEEEIKQLLESGQAQLIDAKTMVYKMTPKTDTPIEDEVPDPLEVPAQTYETRELRAQPMSQSSKVPPAEARRRKYKTKDLQSPSFEMLDD